MHSTDILLLPLVHESFLFCLVPGMSHRPQHIVVLLHTFVLDVDMVDLTWRRRGVPEAIKIKGNHKFPQEQPSEKEITTKGQHGTSG